jgi:hypothetical protein
VFNPADEGVRVRRYLGFVVIGLGVALLTLAGSFRYWAYPQIAQVGAEYPVAEDIAKGTTPPAGTTVSTGRATVFIAVKGQPVGPQEVEVVSTRTTKGDPKFAKDSSVYWETRVDTAVPSVADQPISTTVEGLCFNAHTALQQANCPKKGYFQTGVEESSRTTYDRRQGIYLKFPFGTHGTQETSYDFWDSASGKTFPAKYVGEERIQGLTVYKFVQVVPEQSIGLREGMPGEIFGQAQGTTVTADTRYSNLRTVWIEPETGIIIRGQEEQKRFFSAGGKTVPALVGTIGYNDATVKANVAAVQDKVSGLRGLRSTIPLGAGLIGLLLTGLGIALGFGGAGARASGSGDGQRVVPRSEGDLQAAGQG